ncbi:hypothetical protein HG530_011461 [Fusarium avenaceum]|nr:hypothetical protein HG530_011461 [Fusarium avenaceum]
MNATREMENRLLTAERVCGPWTCCVWGYGASKSVKVPMNIRDAVLVTPKIDTCVAAEVIYKSLAWSDDQKERKSKWPHGPISEERTRFSVENPVLLPLGRVFRRVKQRRVLRILADRSVAPLEQGAAVEQPALLQLLDRLVDEVVLVNDPQRECPEKTHGGREDREEDKEAEYIQVTLGSVWSCLREQTGSRLTQPHGTQAETRERPVAIYSVVRMTAEFEIQLSIHAGRETISGTKQDSSRESQRLKTDAIADISDERNRQVESDRASDGDSVDLELGVVQTRLQKRRIEGEDDDGAAREGDDVGRYEGGQPDSMFFFASSFADFGDGVAVAV